MTRKKILKTKATIYCTEETKNMLFAYRKHHRLGSYEEALSKLLLEN